MNFIFRSFQIFFQSGLALIFFFSPVSCQNLQSEKKAQTHKKNVDNHKYSSTEVIDKNYFEFCSDSAYLKAEMAFFEGNNREALEYFKKALLFSPQSPHLYKRIAEIYEQEGLFAEALHYHQKLKSNKGEDIESQKKLTELYHRKGLYGKALDNQEKLLQRYPDRFSLWFEQAILLSYYAQWGQALKALEKAEQKALNLKQKAPVLLSKAYIYAKLQKPSQVLGIIQQLESAPNQTEEIALKLADFYTSLGQSSLAVQYLEKVQQTTDEKGLISKALLKYYLSKSDWKKALQQMQNIQTLGQLEEPHYFYMALLYLEKKDYNKSLVYLKDLLMKAPKQGQYLYLMAFAYEKKGEWFSALQTYNKVRNSSPHFLAAQLQIAHIWKEIGLQERAFALLGKLSFPEKGKMQAHPLLLYAESLWNSGYKGQALTLLTKGLKIKPFHTDILFLRGLYLRKSGRYHMAVRDIKQILERKKEHEEALNFLADFYSEQKVHLHKAERLARKALSLKPHFSPFLSTLGWILFQKGKWKSALYYLNKAYLNDKNTLIAKRLGKVHFVLKNFEKSDYFFKEAKRLKKHEEKNQASIPKQARIH